MVLVVPKTPTYRCLPSQLESTYVQWLSDVHVKFSINDVCMAGPSLPTSSGPRAVQRVGGRVRARVRYGVGLVWAAHTSFRADLQLGSRHTYTAHYFI